MTEKTVVTFQTCSDEAQGFLETISGLDVQELIKPENLKFLDLVSMCIELKSSDKKLVNWFNIWGEGYSVKTDDNTIYTSATIRDWIAFLALVRHYPDVKKYIESCITDNTGIKKLY